MTTQLDHHTHTAPASQPTASSDSAFLALRHSPSEVQEILTANLDGQQISPFDLPRVKIPGGESTTWEVPSLEGAQPAKVLEGIVIHFKLVRAYWPGEFTGSEPPACSSPDSRIGIGDPGGACATCPLAQFGTDPKAQRGQACKQMEQWFLLRADTLLPLVLSLPPMSLTAARKYRLNLVNAMLQVGQVVTRVSLETRQNPDGQKFAVAVPTMASRLSEDEAARAAAYAVSLRPVLERASAADGSSPASTPVEDLNQ